MAKAKIQKTGDPVMDAINAKFGNRTISQLSEVPSKQYDVVSTGSMGLDHALGVDGLPRGRIVEIYGPESSGKTTLTLHILANAQAQGLPCVFIDAEHALDIRYAAALGVDVKSLWVCQPDYGEQALEIVNNLASAEGEYVIVVDSVAALTPRAEIEGEIGDYHVGVQARMMSQSLRKLVGVASRTKTTIIFINQLRMKIGVKFGSPETTTGGNALKFYASVRLDTRRIGGVKGEGEQQVANRTRVRVKKNKVAPPFTEAEFNIEFGTGIDRYTEMVELGVATGVVKQSGAWFSYGDKKLGQGRARVAKSLAETHRDGEESLADRIEDSIRTVLAETGAISLTTKPEEDKKAKGKKAQTSSTTDAVTKLLQKSK